MHPLTSKIAALQRRFALRQRAAAACWTAATLIAAALVLGLVDYVVRFRDSGLRIMATSTLVMIVVWAVYRWWYLPGRRPHNPLAMARRVEANFPQLNDSLASALEFLEQSEEDLTAGSAQLRRLVVTEAQTVVEGLPLDAVIDRRPLRRASGWLAAACFVLALCLAWDTAAVGTALARLAAPLGSTQWPRQNHLAFRNPPTRLAAGQSFEAELVDTASDLPDEVRIEYRMSRGGRREAISEQMMRVGEIMLARRENIRHAFAFRATGGDDDTMPWHWVEVVEAPQLKSLAITVHPPAYTGLAGVPAERHIHVLAGTGIEVRGTATEELGAARILPAGATPIDATIHSDDEGHDRHGFRVAPDKWIATKSGPYRVELADVGGLAGVAGQWNLRVDPDSPPSVVWQRPSDNLYVTANALVPIELVVKDNVAVHRVELAYDRSDWSEAERERVSAAARIEFYKAPEKSTPQSAAAAGPRGESRVVEYSWDLAALKLPVGAEVTIEASAADYRPGIGRTAGPRRIIIITADELEARLADRQAQIVRQLERALAAQQFTREDVRRVEIQLRDAGTMTSEDRNTLQSAELNQRRVGRLLIDSAEGVPPLVDAVLSEIEMNRTTTSDLRETMHRLMAELEGLSAGSLNVAENELTAARKAVESADDVQGNQRAPMSAGQAASLLRALSVTGASQDEITATLERLINQLSGKADYRRFARLVAELRDDQLTHEKATREDIGVETLPLRLSELTRGQLATLKKAAAGQNAIAARFEKIEQGMDRLAQELKDEQNEAAAKLAAAVGLARSLAVASSMNETARELAQNRVGGALARESKIAADLQQIVDTLRGSDERRPQELASQLREAEEKLNVLRQRLSALQQQIAEVEQHAADKANVGQLQQLGKRQQDLQRQIEQLAQALDRLEVSEAAKSARQAAGRLDSGDKNNEQRPQNVDRPSPSSDVEKSQQDLEKAAQQLADRRQQAEDDLALEIVRRFQSELTDMIARQRQVIGDTEELDRRRQTKDRLFEDDIEATSKLAAQERALADIAKEHGELLGGLGAVRISLEETERRLAAAANVLDERDTGSRAQQLEHHALARLEGMMEAFAQTAADAAQNQTAQPGAAPAGEQPQRRPTFELLEVKVLRMLQADLQERTRAYEQRLAADGASMNQSQRTEFEREAQDLSAEQGRLAELVETMLTRDNESAEQ